MYVSVEFVFNCSVGFLNTLFVRSDHTKWLSALGCGDRIFRIFDRGRFLDLTIIIADLNYICNIKTITSKSLYNISNTLRMHRHICTLFQDTIFKPRFCHRQQVFAKQTCTHIRNLTFVFANSRRFCREYCYLLVVYSIVFGI